MSKKAKIIGKVAQFKMSLKGGKLPDGFEVYLDTKIDFENVSVDELIKVCASGQTSRVTLQNQLRQKSVQELENLEKSGLEIKFKDIYDDKIIKPIDKILLFDRIDFVKMMIEDFDMEQDQAHELFNKKHGLEPGSREEK